MTTRTCQNCSVAYGPDDMFCENCGYDFITGSLPPDAAPQPPATRPRPPAAGAAPSVLDPDRTPAPPSIPGSPSGEQAGVSQEGATAAEVPRLRLAIAADRSYFDEVVNDGEIDFPDPLPADRELELAGHELHIGRTSESRAIHPDVDVAALTGDQAVSSRHAVLRIADDGTFTIVDVGSTNGTFLDAVDSEAITQGVPVPVKPGVPIFVGAWTRITILE